MTDENSKTAIKKSPFKWAIGAALIVWAVWLVNLAVLHNSTADLRGTFGDMFGASNAIFSGLALVGLIYAIIQQQEQLELAREELSTARSDLKETKKLSEEQSDHIQKQNELALKRDAENTFFQILTLAANLKDNLSYFVGGNGTIASLKEYRGAIAIKKVYSNHKGKSSSHVQNFQAHERYIEITDRLDVTPYVGTIANALLYAYENFEEPKKYFRLVLGTLTHEEFVLLGLLSIESRYVTLRNLIEEKGLLILPAQDDGFTNFLRDELNENAFKGGLLFQ